MATEHATTGDAINHAVDKASAGLEQIAHALSSAAPQAWAVAVHGVYAQGLATVISGALGVAASLLMLLVAFRLGQRANWKDGCIFAWTAVVLLVGSMIGIIYNMSSLCDAYSWARVISPDGVLAQQILSKAL